MNGYTSFDEYHPTKHQEPVLKFCNDKAKILDTNYWTSGYAASGMCYLSGNAGDWRLLIPAKQSEMVREFSNVKRASIEPSIVRKGAFDIIAEDGTDSPFCITLDKRMIDRAVTRKRCRLLIYTSAGLIANMPVQVRP